MGIRRLLNFIIGAEWAGGDAVAQAKGDIKGLEADTRSSGGAASASLANVALGVTAVGIAFKGAQFAARKTWEAVNDGAAIASVNQQLRAMATGSNIASDSLQSSLKRALLGTVTDAKATELALKAMRNGADTIPEITANVIQQAEAMGLLAGGARTAAGELAAVTVNQRNYLDALKAQAATDIGSLFGGGGRGGRGDFATQSLQKQSELQQRLNALIASGVKYGVDYNAIQLQIYNNETKQAESAIKAAEAKRSLALAVEAVDSKLGQYINYAGRAIGVSTHLAGTVRNLAGAFSDLRRSQFSDALGPGGYPYITDDRLAAGQAASTSYNQRIGARRYALATAGPSPQEIINSQIQRGIELHQQYGLSLDEIRNKTGGYAGAIFDANAAMLELTASTGSMFDQARRGKDFNPAEFYYQQLLEFGGSAQQLKDALIAGGLESPERANEIFNQAQRMQAIRNVAQQTVAGGVNGGTGWQVANATADQAIAGQYSGATINQGGQTITINFNGDVMDPDQIAEIIDAHLQAAYQAGGGTP